MNVPGTPTDRARAVLELLKLAPHESLTHATIARRIGVRPSMIYNLLTDTVNAGWVVVPRQVSFSWLTRRYQLTDAGKAVLS